jgi:hypothetical protein
VKAATERDNKKTTFSEVETKDHSTGASAGKSGPKTPKKPELTDYGMLETPVGRRSARIAVKSAIKDH